MPSYALLLYLFMSQFLYASTGLPFACYKVSYYFAILCCDEGNGLARSKNKHCEKLTRQEYDGAEWREMLRLKKEKGFYLNTPGVEKTVLEAVEGKPFGLRE